MVQSHTGIRVATREEREERKILNNSPGIKIGKIEVPGKCYRSDFNPLSLNWVVSPHRRDKRTGWINAKNNKELSDYAKELYNTITFYPKDLHKKGR